jgi:hypothetical protein
MNDAGFEYKYLRQPLKPCGRAGVSIGLAHSSTWEMTMASTVQWLLVLVVVGLVPVGASGQVEPNYAGWPVLTSSFPSTGGGGITIKGYDPVISGKTCMTTFMAVTSDAEPKVFPSYIEFDAVPAQGGVLCTNGKWKSFDGASSGTTPFKVFFKDGVFRGGQ